MTVAAAMRRADEKWRYWERFYTDDEVEEQQHDKLKCECGAEIDRSVSLTGRRPKYCTRCSRLNSYEIIKRYRARVRYHRLVTTVGWQEELPL